MRLSFTPGLIVAALLGLLTVVVGPATPAAAHNRFVGSSPAAGSTTDRVPETVVLTFDQPVLGLGTGVVVTGPDGEVQDGPPRPVDNTVSQDLRPGAQAGQYRVTWRVTSTDGHPISGEFTFTAVAAGRGSAAPPAPAADRAAPGGGGNAWWWLLAGAVALAGLVVAVVVARRNGPT